MTKKAKVFNSPVPILTNHKLRVVEVSKVDDMSMLKRDTISKLKILKEELREELSLPKPKNRPLHCKHCGVLMEEHNYCKVIKKKPRKDEFIPSGPVRNQEVINHLYNSINKAKLSL